MNKKKLVSRTRHALYLRRRHNPQYRVTVALMGSYKGVVIPIAYADTREAAREAKRRWLEDKEVFEMGDEERHRRLMRLVAVPAGGEVRVG